MLLVIVILGLWEALPTLGLVSTIILPPFTDVMAALGELVTAGFFYTHLQVTLTEGKNREIRRMLARLGHKVMKLRRVAFGPIQLGDLAPGKARQLRPDEVAALQKAVTLPGPPETSKCIPLRSPPPRAASSRERPVVVVGAMAPSRVRTSTCTPESGRGTSEAFLGRRLPKIRPGYPSRRGASSLMRGLGYTVAKASFGIATGLRSAARMISASAGMPATTLCAQ